ncbi:MAG: hypothetical protein M3Q28_12085 [Pseudomonadota bacterium]|nr:hypothetical protein [Pseudomonadota bacterium]
MAASQHAAAHGTSSVLVSVSAVPSEVTLSRPGAQSFASYQVTIKNTGGSVAHVRFRGMTDVTGADVALFINPNVSGPGVVLDPNPVVVSSGKVRCTIEGRNIDCDVDLAGHLLPPGGVASFYAVVRAPVIGSLIDFRWNAQYGAGSAERLITGSTVTALQAAGGDSVSTYVPRAGVTLSTGVEAVPTGDDRSTTRLTVAPQDSTPIIASIADDDNGGNSCSPHVQCFGHTVTVLKAQTQTKASLGDGLRKLLVIVLRRDASTIRRGANVEQVVIHYQLDRVIGGGGIPVRSCRVNGYYVPPGPNDPCIRERREYRKKNGHGPDDDDHDDRHRREQSRNNSSSSGLSGDWEIVIEAFDNGSFVW